MSDISKVVDLPNYIVNGNLSVEEAINKRRSVRTYSDNSLTLVRV